MNRFAGQVGLLDTVQEERGRFREEAWIGRIEGEVFGELKPVCHGPSVNLEVSLFPPRQRAVHFLVLVPHNMMRVEGDRRLVKHGANRGYDIELGGCR